jgi:hypothetical protein
MGVALERVIQFLPDLPISARSRIGVIAIVSRRSKTSPDIYSRDSSRMFPNRGRRCRSPIAIDDRSSVAIRAYNDVATAPISDGATDLHAGDANATRGAIRDLIFAVQNLAVRHGHSDRALPQSPPLKVNSGGAGFFRRWIERKKAGVSASEER